jgi:DNA repair protein RecN (Recombination protein N)
MLTELRIRNFALIDQLVVQLGPGLNVLTGETGAGKSIVVGALSLLLGERASADVVRAGAERASIEGVFDATDRSDVAAWLDEHGMDCDEGLVILKREVAVEGRSRAWINGAPTTAALLGALGAVLVSLHGQHEHQTLLRRDEQRAILDAYGGTEPLVARVGLAHSRLREVRAEIRALEARRREIAERADFLRYQAEEIEAAALSPAEEEALEQEQRRLSHSEELTALAGGLTEALSGDEEGLVARVGALRRAIDALLRIDGSQAELSELFDTAYYALDELGSRLASYLENVEHDPDRLERIRKRQDLIFRLTSKYGDSVEAVLATGERARRELDLLEDGGWETSSLQARENESAAELQALVEELTSRRAAAAEAVAAEVNRVLPELGMAGGRFEIGLSGLAEPGPHGADEVEFRISLNRGFDPRPLSTVASGGELSRVMLALKTILARMDAVPTLVFDEVDAGIGGRVALQVGDKMREVAGSHQVFAITHLPQIASRAHTHLRVSKLDGAERIATRVEVLEGEERVRELARMLGGDPESDASLRHARELLQRAASPVEPAA